MEMNRTDLRRLVRPGDAEYSTRFSEDFLDRQMFRGDPVADNVVHVLRESGYNPDGGQYGKLQRLAVDGVPEAVEFFEAARAKPDWLDEDLIRYGRRFPLGLVDFYGLSLMHSLFAGGLFMRAGLVTSATGRLGSDTQRRMRETAGFVAQVMDKGGLVEGSPGYETILRVRLLHGSIRYWTTHEDAYESKYIGVPIDQTMLAMTLILFSYLNVRSFLRMGIPLRDSDIEAHQHRWRYVGYLLGIQDSILCANISEEKELWSALVKHQLFPEMIGPDVFDAMVSAMAGAAENTRAPDPEALMRALLLKLSGPEWFGLDSEVEAPFLQSMALTGAATSIGTAFRLVPPIQGRMMQRGRGLLGAAVDAGKKSGYGVVIGDQEDALREFSAKSAVAVQERFAHLDEAALAS